MKNITWRPLQESNPTVWSADDGSMCKASIYAQDGGYTLFFSNGKGHSGKGHSSANLGDFPTLEAAQARAQQSFDLN